MEHPAPLTPEQIDELRQFDSPTVANALELLIPDWDRVSGLMTPAHPRRLPGHAAGRRAGHYWSADGRINVPYESWVEDAYLLSIDRCRVPAVWARLSTREEDRTERDARHVVVARVFRRPLRTSAFRDIPLLTRMDVARQRGVALPQVPRTLMG